jgi:hypothetical protein
VGLFREAGRMEDFTVCSGVLCGGSSSENEPLFLNFFANDNCFFFGEDSIGTSVLGSPERFALSDAGFAFEAAMESFKLGSFQLFALRSASWQEQGHVNLKSQFSSSQVWQL